MLLTRHKMEDQEQDFDAAITLRKRAITISTTENPYVSSLKFMLGTNMSRKPVSSPEWLEARKLLFESCDSPVTLPTMKIATLNRPINIREKDEDYSATYDLARKAIGLLRSIHNRSLSPSDQKRGVGTVFWPRYECMCVGVANATDPRDSRRTSGTRTRHHSWVAC
jgi:hypothetical protein